MSSGDWIPASRAKADGRLCKLRVRDSLGTYEVSGPFFFHEDGKWYRVDPPMQVKNHVSYFMPLSDTISVRDDETMTETD